MRRKNSSAFTIVEIVVVVTIIAILSSIAVLTFDNVRKDSRDAARLGNATIISEALEKYYEKNGEYPSVASIVNDVPANTGEVVASKLSIPVKSLMMPHMPDTATNGITSGTEPHDDYLAYSAQSTDDNLGCQNDATAGCDQFTLRYAEEGSGDTKAIESRRSSRITILKPELEVTLENVTSIKASWTAVPDASSYELQRSLSYDMTSPVTSSHTGTSATASSLNPDTEYFFRVRAHISDGNKSDWSDIQSEATSSLDPPTGTISIAAAMSGTNARGTASGGSCTSGTIEYQIRYQINGGSWQSWTTGTPRDVAATEGYAYTFQAQARCKVGSASGPWEQSTTASVTRGVTAPSGLTMSATMSGTNARGTAGGGSCATGTTIERQIQYLGESYPGNGSWSSYTTGSPRDVAANQGWQYTFRQQARCVGITTSSGWATSSTDSIVRPISAPSGLTITAAMSGTNARGTAGGGSCPSGTAMERQIHYNSTTTPSDGSWSSYTSGTPRDVGANEGWKYTFQQQARCSSVYANSGWGTSSSASTVRPITTAPATPSVTDSTSGNTTTWSWPAVSCPTGTIARYEYRSVRDGGYTTSDWYGPYQSYTSTAWYTNEQGYNYTRQVRAHCYTTHSTGPVSGIGQDSYLRPISTPGTITNVTHTIDSGRTKVEIRWTIPSCGAGTIPYGYARLYMYGGWGSWYGWNNPFTGFNATISPPPFPSNYRLGVQGKYKCVNPDTARESAEGPMSPEILFNV